MGFWMTPKFQKLTIGRETKESITGDSLSYLDLSDATIDQLTQNDRLSCIQVDEDLPIAAFYAIDKLLARSEKLVFRLFHLFDVEKFDMSKLLAMKHLKHLEIKLHLRQRPDLIDLEEIAKMIQLRSLYLDMFDCKDYSFIEKLPESIECLSLVIDSSQGTPVFDCQWLLQFSTLHQLHLEKKAKKNIQCIGKLPNLRKLSLRGISVKDLYFLEPAPLEEFSLLYCGMQDLSSLVVLQGLKYLELWRILKLTDISPVAQLPLLEVLKLEDLKHVKVLPDFALENKLKKIWLLQVGIKDETIREDLRLIVSRSYTDYISSL